MKLTKCPISGSDQSIEYLNLGNIPIVNNLCDTREESLSSPRFPLAIQFFTSSSLSCLTEVVEKDKLFLNYFYHSNVNKPYLDHCSRMYEYILNYVDIDNDDLIVDIGGNDGSLLQQFKKENPHLSFLNIDCSKTFIETNISKGFQYYERYFDSSIELPHKAKIITSTNVFQHTEDIRSFVKGVEKNLSIEGIWCLEFPYLLATLMNNNYDQIYHEHIYYYRLKNIIDLLDQEGLKVINVSFHDIHNGTLRVISTKFSSKKQADNTIQSILNLEQMITPEYCVNWGKQMQEKIHEFKTYIKKLVDDGNIIAGFGAAAKGCIFLNTCELDDSSIKFIIDDTESKQGKYVPTTGIQIVSREVLKSTHVDYIIILAHNFKDYIIESLKDQYNGKFIIMFPNIQII